jgi:uncharacterized membrane protein
MSHITEVDTVRSLSFRILLIVLGIIFVFSNAYDASINGLGFWSIWGIVAGIVLILIGIFAKEFVRKK